ncbi:lovastatin nonaketide synthase [Phaeosphaeria sp. MPI-PUGE-AT-0046c]|nr:lovastatin nonaketide synthase [Phaeosphaeria sp. MPI-PUGE-AT-0046c]
MVGPVAIVGSACRFPGGASSVSRLWELLKKPKDILDDPVPAARGECGIFDNSDNRTNRSYLLQDDVRHFDAAFFKTNAKEADAMDPQHRILLETVFEAMESAGISITQARGSLTSVHVGAMTADYNDIQMRDPETLQMYAATGLSRSMLANRISYFFDLKGPSETIDTACSSSLVALHHAVQSIETGDVAQSIVAGTALFLDSAMYMAESNLQMLSPDSRCRMWDKDANGYSRGEGCAAILIKPLSTALKDGDDIECIIRATAVNSDGRTSGITMPSTAAQVKLIRKTYEKAGLNPINNRCQYFECHGTGTPAGDPVEAAAIQQAFFLEQNGSCKDTQLYCGSIKTVIGHLEGCAGLAGILKASLAIRHKTIPPNLHFHSLNPKIKPYYSHLCVPTSLVPWPEVEHGPLRASVNSFGFGGTNAHVILESYDCSDMRRKAIDDNPSQTLCATESHRLFVFSAECESSLLEYLKRMIQYLKHDRSVALDDLEWTLSARRSTFSTRTYIAASNREMLMQRLDEKICEAETDPSTQAGICASYTNSVSSPKILGIFTGQGAQWVNMGRELIHACPFFKRSLLKCEEALFLLPDGPSWSLIDALINGDSLPTVLPARIAQPLCTAVQIALVDILHEVGITFNAVVGHSSGEVAAAYAAGILSTRDAIAIAYYRGVVAHLSVGRAGKKGAMMAVGMTLDEAVELCNTANLVDRVEVAASNAPSSITLSGDTDAIQEAKAALDERNIFTKILGIGVAYHSHHMVPCALEYAKTLRELDIQPRPATRNCIWYSSVKHDMNLVDGEREHFKSQYWVDNMVKPVLFQQALQKTLEQCENFAAALEVGPHPAMRISVRDTLNMMQRAQVRYVGCLEREKHDLESMTASLGSLWCYLGNDLVNLSRWRNLTGLNSQPKLLKGIPAYAWDHRSTYWQISRLSSSPSSKTHPPHELLGRLHENLKDELTWRNVFSQSELPWLKGHVVHGKVVFPGAAYISMVAQAAQQLLNHGLRSLELRNVQIRKPLVFSEVSDKVETLFRVHVRHRSGTATDRPALEATFTCYSGTAVPVNIGRIFLVNTSDHDLGPHCNSTNIQAHLVESTRTEQRVNIDMYHGRTNTSRVQIENLVLKPLMEPHPSEDRVIFAKTVWDMDVAHGFPDPPMTEITDREFEHVEAIERTSLFYLQSICRMFPKEKRRKLHSRYQAMFRGIETLLNRLDEQQVHLKPVWFNDTYEDIEKLRLQFRDSVDIALLAAVGESLPSVVRGETEMLEHMLKHDLLSRLYSEGRGFAECNHHVAYLMQKLSFKLPRARILEIGAGTGATTQKVLEAIDGAFTSYTYTDVSAGFFEKAAERFNDYAERMKFKRFNVEAAPASQGITEASYDVVIAANVLHATRQLTKTIRHARSLLRPGGYLIAVEVTGNMLRETGLMAGLEGWWLGADDGRFPTPGIRVEHWDQLLSENGFSGIDKVIYDCSVISKHNCSVFVTRAVDEQLPALTASVSVGDLRWRPSAVIIGGESPAVQYCMAQAKNLLQPHMPHVIMAKGFDQLNLGSIPRDANVLCLTELDKTIFSSSTIQEASLLGLQKLFGIASNIVWVTAGSQDEDPYANMMAGVGRSLAFEIPNLRIQFLNFDISSAWNMKLAVKSLIQMVQFSSSALGVRTAMWDHEPEIQVKNDAVLIPRIIPDSAANIYLNATRRLIMEEMASSGDSENDRPSQESLGLSKIRVAHSTSMHTKPEPTCYLCSGLLEGEGTSAVALVDSEASVIRADPKNVVQCPSSYHIDAEGLMAFGAALIALHILDNSPTDANLLIHDPPPGVAEALSMAVNSVGCEIKVTRSSVGELRLPQPHSRRSSRGYRNTGVLWLFSSFTIENASIDIGETVSVRRFDPRAITLQDAATPTLFQLAEQLKDLTSTTVDLEMARPDFEHHERLAKVKEWLANASKVFASNRTYFLIGMTGDLGHSLCRFLVHHGVQHIALASRAPLSCKGWVATLNSRLGTDIRVFQMDITDKKQVHDVVKTIRHTMPPIAGVANAALVLNDSLFINTTQKMIEKQLKPKTEGTLNLHDEFSEQKLDFFIAFSSLATIYGNAGQSIYHAANMFMTGLVNHRRKKGLAASVLHLGMVVDVGFVARAQREQGTIEQHLKSKHFTPLAETEFHHAFVQAVLASNPETSDGGVIIGIQPYVDIVNTSSRPPWYNHPRFSHMIVPFLAHAKPRHSTSNKDSRELFIHASTRTEAEDVFRKTFIRKIEIMIKTAANRINVEAPLANLGLDSLLAVEIRAWLFEQFELDVPLLGILGHESISSITSRAWDESVLLSHRQEQKTDHPLFEETVVGLPRVSRTVDDAPLTIPTEHSDTNAQSLCVPTEIEGYPQPCISQDDQSSLFGNDSTTSVVSTAASENTLSDKELVQMRYGQMSFAQASMHFMQSVLDDPTMFNVTVQYSIVGPLDIGRFCRAFSKILERHESYRTMFLVDQPQMRALQAVVCRDLGVEKDDITVIQDQDSDVQHVFHRLSKHKYALSTGDTFQAFLVAQSATLHTFIMGCHHIIMDGYSWHIFFRDLTRAYQTLPLPKLVESTLEFSRLQHADSVNEVMKDSLGYWLKQMDPVPQMLPPLPLSRRARKDFQPTYQTTTARRSLDHASIHRIVNTSKDNQATTMQFYLAVIASMFARLIDSEEICVGVTDAGRGHFTESVGHFTNLLPMRLQTDRRKPFLDVLHHTSHTVRQGMRHKRVPFELLLEKLGMHRTSRAAPLFQIAFNFRVGELLDVKLGDCSMTLERYQDAKTPYDLVFNVTQTETSHLVELTSNRDMYPATTTQWILDTYINMLHTLASLPSLAILDRRLCAQTQVDDALSLGRGPQVRSKWPATLIERFHEVCESFPDTTAIKDAEGLLTYRQLLRRVNNLALVISKAGIAAGDHVVVYCETSKDTFAVMLGILHIGAVYVPLDVTVPRARQLAVTTACQPKLIICDTITSIDAEELCAGHCRISKLNLADIPTLANESAPRTFRDYSFLLFTSGSTGTPKGVQLHQSGIMNYAAAKAAILDLEHVSVLQQSSTGFDMSLAQAFNAIANAGTLVIVSSDARGDPSRISELMLRESIQFTIFTPSEYSTLTTYAADTLRQCHSWKYACSGGEILKNALLDGFRKLDLPDLILVDCYGPTELSCATTLQMIPLKDTIPMLDATRTVGKPIPNTSLYISGADHEPQPIGFAGEICVGGKGVALGYLGDHLDSSKFIRGSLAEYSTASRDFEVVYRTGDKGCMCEDGSIVLMGRIEGDTVVKLRGLRIDLEEVASCILKTSQGMVIDAVVTIRGTPEYLVAHVVLAQVSDQHLSSLEILRSELPLPRYMIPTLLVPLSRVPTTANGKVDRKALAAMPLPKQDRDQKQRTQLNVSEGELQLLWRAVLGEPAESVIIEPGTDFFTIGGSSLLLLQLQHAIKEKMGATIDLVHMYHSSTLRKMAAVANQGRSQLASEVINWKEETRVPQEMLTSVCGTAGTPPRLKERVVVLTGAAGFLGSHILAALIANPEVARIHCIAVSADMHARHPPSSKVIVHHGTLSSPTLGLSGNELAVLKSDMDQIVHAGAQGHCLNNYDSVKSANFASTQVLAELGATRAVPFHFISSPRVVLLSGSHSAPPVPMSAFEPPTDGSEGFMACKWASEVYLENFARATDLPVVIHRPCSLLGSSATHDDALNSVIQFSLLSRVVPELPQAHGFFDFRLVDEVAVEIASGAPARAGVAFRHHSSGVKVPFSELASRMEQLYGGTFTSVGLEQWIEKAVERGLPDLIVSYLRANVVGRGRLDFPYLGEEAQFGCKEA